MAFTASIFTKPTITQQSFMDIYRSLYKSDEKCRMYGQNSICALELSMVFIAPLSTELITTQ